MFKKITLLYSALIFVTIFSLMILLIITTLFNIIDDKNSKISHMGSVNANNINQEIRNKNTLRISTDKNVYATNEDILIIFENTGNVKMSQSDNYPITVRCRPNIGDNYELAFIEYKDGDNWIAIEPVSRCSNDCNKPCLSNTEIASKTKTSFTWSQTVLQCTDSDADIDIAPLGSYRIGSATWDKNSSSVVKIYSNIFKISNLSKF